MRILHLLTQKNCTWPGVQLIGRILVWQIPGISDAYRYARIYIPKIHTYTQSDFPDVWLLCHFFKLLSTLCGDEFQPQALGNAGKHYSTYENLSCAVELREGSTPCVTQAGLEAVSHFLCLMSLYK